MSREPEKKAQSSPIDGGDEDGDERLDDRLRQLGAEFLDEKVPDSLLDVLRKGLASQTGNVQPADAGDGEATKSPGDKK